ncbi:MAG: hypothetical protein V1493_06655, partial [Candidatus Diapherotrites archaeon]
MLEWIFVSKVLFVLYAQFLLFIALLIANFRNLKGALGIDWRFLLAFFVLTAALLLPLIVVSPPGERLQEGDVPLARGFLQMKDFSYSAEFSYGPFYPYLLYLSFLFFGFNPFLADALSFVFLFLSCVIVFLFAHLLFRGDAKSTFLALAVFIFMQFLLLPSQQFPISMEHTHKAQFFIIFPLFLLFMAFKINKWPAYALALQSIMLASEVKFEFFALWLFLPAGLFLFRRESLRAKSFPEFFKKKLLVPLGLALVFFPVFLYGFLYILPNFFSYDLLSFNEHWDLGNLLPSIQKFLEFWLCPAFFGFAVLLILAIFLIALNREKSKGQLFVLAAFAFFSVFYSMAKKEFSPRYAALLLPLVALVAASSLFFLAKSLPRPAGKLGKKEAELACTAVFAVLILAMAAFLPGVYANFKDSHGVFVFNDELDLASHLDCSEGSLLIVQEELTQMRFNALTFCNLISLEYLVRDSKQFASVSSFYQEKYDFLDIENPQRRVSEPKVYSELLGLFETIFDESTQDMLENSSLELSMGKKTYFADFKQLHSLHLCRGLFREHAERIYEKMSLLVTEKYALREVYSNENITLYEITG